MAKMGTFFAAHIPVIAAHHKQYTQSMLLHAGQGKGTKMVYAIARPFLFCA